MSTDSTVDETELSAMTDAIATGAATDSSATDDKYRDLPRLLRYAMLVSADGRYIDQRLAAEIDTVCPDIALTAGWLAGRAAESGHDLGTDVGLLLAASSTIGPSATTDLIYDPWPIACG